MQRTLEQRLPRDPNQPVDSRGDVGRSDRFPRVRLVRTGSVRASVDPAAAAGYEDKVAAILPTNANVSSEYAPEEDFVEIQGSIL